MKLIISTHNLKLTKAIERRIISRIEKLASKDRFAIDARVILEHDNTKAPGSQFSCSMRLSVPGPDLFAEHAEEDLYTAIDLVTKKIQQQIRKKQSKYKARKHKEAAKVKKKRQSTSS